MQFDAATFFFSFRVRQNFSFCNFVVVFVGRSFFLSPTIVLVQWPSVSVRNANQICFIHISAVRQLITLNSNWIIQCDWLEMDHNRFVAIGSRFSVFNRCAWNLSFTSRLHCHRHPKKYHAMRKILSKNKMKKKNERATQRREIPNWMLMCGRTVIYLHDISISKITVNQDLCLVLEWKWPTELYYSFGRHQRPSHRMCSWPDRGCAHEEYRFTRIIRVRRIYCLLAISKTEEKHDQQQNWSLKSRMSHHRWDAPSMRNNVLGYIRNFDWINTDNCVRPTEAEAFTRLWPSQMSVSVVIDLGKDTNWILNCCRSYPEALSDAPQSKYEWISIEE